MKSFHFTTEITRDYEINKYIGIVPFLPEELTDEELKTLPECIGFQQISLAL